MQVPRQLDGRIVLDVPVPVQRHWRRGLQRVPERIRHVPSVLPDVHDERELQRQCCVGDWKPEDGLHVHVPQLVDRRELLDVRGAVQRDGGLRDVCNWLCGIW